MIPTLYEKNETEFTTNGLGRLADAISCEVTEERNGVYELVMEYPITGIHYEDLEEERIILAKPSQNTRTQPFQIYRVNRQISGIVTVYAQHISYLLNRIVVMPFTASSCAATLAAIPENTVNTCPFEFDTDKEVVADYTLQKPMEVRTMLGGDFNSILKQYGAGDYEFDRFSVYLHVDRGTDNGVTIRYRKNLTDIIRNTNMGNCYTGIVPYWQSDETLVTIPEEVIYSTHRTDFAYDIIKTVDFSDEWTDPPTEQQLRSRATQYVNNNEGWEINDNITISFVPLWQTEEYKNVAALERVGMCDTVTVIYEPLGISATTRVVKTVWDVLRDRYTSIELGATHNTLGKVINGELEEELQRTRANIVTMVDHQTELLRGGLGGYLVINTDEDGKPYEIVFMDAPTIGDETQVLVINENGIGFGNRYGGPYTTAWTLDGTFNANYIQTGTLNAARIKAGVLEDAAHNFSLNLETGAISIGGYVKTSDLVDMTTPYLSMPYTINGFVVSFDAQFIKGNEDVTLDYPPESYTWYKKEDYTLTYLGSGYTWTFDLQDFEYGGSIVLRFEAMEYDALEDADGNTLTDVDGNVLFGYVSAADQPYITCETDFTNGTSVAALALTSEQVLSRLNHYDGTNQTFESAIAQTAHSIALTVSGSAGAQTAAGIEISLLDADGNVIDSADGDITISGNVVFKSNLTDGATVIKGNNIQTGVISDANSNVIFDLDNGTLDIEDGSINLGNGSFVVTSAGVATMNTGDIGTVTCSGSITGGSIYQTVSGATAGGVSGNSSNGQQASIENGIVTAGQISVKGSAATISLVPEGQDARGYYGIYCTGHFSTNGPIWTNGTTGTADIICRGYSYAVDHIDTSDRRLKEDIKDLDASASSSFIYSLKPVSFRYKEDNTKVQHGFIAQDVQKVVDPDWNSLVVESNAKMIGDDPTLGLAYNQLIADLVATVQTQNKRIEALEAQLKELINDGK